MVVDVRFHSEQLRANVVRARRDRSALSVWWDQQTKVLLGFGRLCAHVELW
jgi:hypothetical protein